MRKPGNCFKQKYFFPNENISGLKFAFYTVVGSIKTPGKWTFAFPLKYQENIWPCDCWLFLCSCSWCLWQAVASINAEIMTKFVCVYILNLDRFCRNNVIVTYRWVKYASIPTKYKSQKAQGQPSCSQPELQMKTWQKAEIPWHEYCIFKSHNFVLNQMMKKCRFSLCLLLVQWPSM